MGYYEDKKKELSELLDLIRREKADFEQLARQKGGQLNKKIELLNYFGIYGKQDSDLAKALEAKEKLNQELVEFEQYKWLAKKQAEDEIKKERLKLEASRRELDKQLEEKRQGLIDLARNLAAEGGRDAIVQLAKEKSLGFPWLAKAYSDYFDLQDQQLANYLESKPQPARRAAEHLKEMATRRRAAEQAYRVLRYQLEYYESLFPWLVDFKGEDIDDLIKQIVEKKEEPLEELKEPDDAAKKWLTAAEYGSLPTVQKYQLALDRYWKRKKTKWEIGRDYERYVGYRYESDGYNVYYQGIVEGFEDLGRDLICVKGNDARIVQCKCWSKKKQIHEKHIFQLYGTVVAYRIDHPNMNTYASFVTSTSLSERAKQFAKELQMEIVEGYPLDSYPCIKCNVSRRDRTKIYHLPFDQQYDKTLVEEERNECYVETVKEAEDLGFRRAFRWHGSTDSTVST